MNRLRHQWAVKRALVVSALEVRQRTGKSLWSQFQEMVRLRRGVGKLRATDYFVYGVYDDGRFSSAAKNEVVSWQPSRLASILNDPHWTAVCDDKLACHSLLKGLGVPFPEIYAVFDAGGRTFGTVPTLRTEKEVVTFLRSAISYPFFGKTVRGAYGLGASFVRAHDPDRDVLELATREELLVEDYVRTHVMPATTGYLFQKPVVQHPLVDRITGGRVGTLRLVILNGRDGPELFRVVWRIPIGQNITDNFLHGTQGNLVAEVDRDTGTVGRMIQGVSQEPNAAGNGRRLGIELQSHPNTGEQITGIVLPDWDVTVSTCLHAAAALPGIRYQSWDVAMGVGGPLVLELNYRGSIDLLQIAGNAGFFDSQFREFWDSHAVKSGRTIPLPF